MGEPEQENPDFANALYEASYQHGTEKIWTQAELLALDVIPRDDVNLLNDCINQLLGEYVFKQMKRDQIVCWRVISRDDAAKYQNLSPDEALVYSQIESAGRDGIWIKTIRTRTNLHQVPANKALKTLENKNLIKQIHANRAASRRIYMLASLQPHEEVSGGPFYSEGNIDLEYIRIACYSLEREIRKKSWQPAKRQRVSIDEEPSEGPRAKDERKPSHRESAPRQKWLPMPAGYLGYPTLSRLTRDFNSNPLSKVKLKEDEVSQLLDILRWEGKIEKVRGGTAYRSVHPDIVHHLEESNQPFTEAPCGRCPVADFCNDEGPVNADTCQYFDRWLGKKE